MKKLLLVFLALLTFGFHADAKEVLFFDSQNLSSNLITDVIQDKDGFIWIATEYGLNRFDGIHFTKYIHDRADSTSLLGNTVRGLYVDRNNVFWIGTNRGLQYYVPEKDVFQTVPFEGNKIYDVIQIFELNDDLIEAYDMIAKRRGALGRGGIADYEKVSSIIIQDFKNGMFGPITFDRLNEE